MTDPVRRAGARTAISSACEPLEPRRLLAVMLDPNFGEGDGQTLLRSPFPYFDDSGGVDVFNPIVPEAIARLSSGYFIVGTHDVIAQSGGAVLSSEAVHALLNVDGTPSENLRKDSDGDGLAFFTRDDLGAGFVSEADYRDLLTLEDGSVLAVVPAAPDGLAPRIVKVLTADGSEHPFFRINDIGEIQAIELLTPEIGVLLTKVEAADAEAPLDGLDFLYELQLFSTATGSLIGDPVQPFGDWLRADRALDVPTLHAGRDGALYVATLTSDLDAAPDPTDSGFLIARLRLAAGNELTLDDGFGAEALPGQETPGVYLPSAGPVTNQAFDLIGSTDQGRLWVNVADSGGAKSKQYALLTPTGALDPAFGVAGIVDVEGFLGDPSQAIHAKSPTFQDNYGGATSTPRPFVRGDGSIVGVYSAPTGTSLPPGITTEFVVGLFGLLPDGSFDPRIAEATSPFGVGRTLLAADVDRVAGTDITQHEATLFMDAQERIVIASQARRTGGSGDVPVYLLSSRILLNTPRAELVDRPGGNRVLEIEGTSGDDRLILRSGSEGAEFRLFGQSAGASESLIGVFSSTDVDLVEITGGDGADVLFSELGDDFSGFVTLFGGNGGDTLSGDGTYTRVFGDAGGDTLLGGVGDQLLFGGAGNDSLLGGSQRDALFGEDGDDILRGQLDGDFLDGGAGNDTLAGDEGDDTTVGGLDNDSMVGGSGVDLVSYAGREEDLVARIGSDGNGPDAGFESDFIGDDFENLLGGNGNDSLAGTDGANFLLGGNGNDTLVGLGGKDTLLAGLGADLLDGGDDNDLLLDFDSQIIIDDADTLLGGGGEDLGLIGSETEDSTEGVEQVFLTLEELLAVL